MSLKAELDRLIAHESGRSRVNRGSGSKGADVRRVCRGKRRWCTVVTCQLHRVRTPPIVFGVKQLTRLGWAASCALLVASACGDDDAPVMPPLTDAEADAGGRQGSEDAGDGTSTETSDESSDESSDDSDSTDTSSETSSGTDGGGGTGGTTTELDGGTPDGEAPDAEGPAAPYQVGVTVEGDLVGLPVLAQAEGPAGGDAAELDYEWEVVNVPTDSALSTEDLEGADSEQVQFNPDRAGTYTFRVTVNGELGTTSILQDIVVRGFQVAYWAMSGNSEQYSTTPSMVRSDGANPRAVGCPRVEAAESEQAWLEQVRGTSQLAMVPHLPNPTETSRWAWSYLVEDEYRMEIGHAETNCDDQQPFEMIGGQRLAFSSDGQRIAFTRLIEGEDDSATIAIFTAANDGSDLRTIRSEADPGLAIAHGVPVSWSDQGRLVWTELVEHDGASHTVVYHADDVEGAFGEEEHLGILLDCRTAETPIPGIREVFLRGGKLIVAAVENSLNTPTKRTIWSIGADGDGLRSCEADAETNTTLTDENAFDLDVTPNGSHIVYYARLNDSAVTTHLYVAPTDGSSEPMLVAGGDNVANTGAHFAAQGRQIVWSKTVFETYPPDAGESTYDRPVSSGVWVVNLDGTGARKLVETLSTPAAAHLLHTGGSGGFCSMSAGGTPGVALSGLLLGLGALLLRRRRQ